MPLLSSSTYLAHLRLESVRISQVLRACDPAARVPTCPDWDAGDLLWHLAEAQQLWARVVRLRPRRPDGEEPTRPSSYAGLLAAYAEHSRELLTELERAGADEEAWHWSGDHRVLTTLRRQAHEVTVHRIDAELTAGLPVTPVGPAFAADGVAEVLAVVYGGEPDWGTFTRTGEAFAVHLTDTGTRLTAVLGKFSGVVPDSGKVYEDEDDLWLAADDPASSVTLSGTAADLYTWLWRRDPAVTAGPSVDHRVRVTGDAAVFDKAAAILAGGID